MKSNPGRLAVLSVFIAAAGQVQAQDGDGHFGEHEKERGRHMWRAAMDDPARLVERLSVHLDLDATQEQQLNNIVDAARPELEQLRESLQENRKAMHALETTDPDYSAKLQNLSAANGELAAQMTLLHGRIRADVHAVLTPEQLAIMEERVAKFRHRRGRHSGDEQRM